ncbi:peptidoglycan editing factor PgeF [Pigmentiphaga aceris]|uniref:Purine nucleoside phosphorylase n=1 Tax=Pigmentiphaga aceris TaxID=1940612 RepID=A0A5C0B2X9_9BURK|nr:peptidoglycan editing factor PgeF [Pigmentiphaga aceris]QEI09229.1 peptidoglycan editing factor PgeF [Pigmentiphaga aceris]
MLPAFAKWAGPSWPGVSAFCSERAGGVSQAPYAGMNLGIHVGDDPSAVAENRARLRTQLPADPCWLDQVHGTEVFDADASSEAQQSTLVNDSVSVWHPPRADAAITQTPGRVLAILTADCLPVVIVDEAATIIGAAHAGWRGLVGGVLESTLTRMAQATGASSSWKAWIGPAIGPQAFEVGADVRDAFLADDAGNDACFVPRLDVPGKWWADLPELAARRLRRAGVAQVELSGRCTVSEPSRYFSYRRDGTTGRIATLAWLNA